MPKLSEEEKRLQQEISEKRGSIERWKGDSRDRARHGPSERDLEQLTKDLAQFRQRTDLLQFEKKQLEEEEGELARREKKEVSDRGRRGRRQGGEKGRINLQSLRKTVEELRGETDRVGGKSRERRYHWPLSKRNRRRWRPRAPTSLRTRKP